MNRVQISKKARFEVFKRDGFACQYCGAHPPDVILEVDHIIPVSEGGRNDEPNLVTACFSCNRGKSDTPLSIVPKTLQEKAAEIREREAQIAGYREAAQAQSDRIEADMWAVADALDPGASANGFRKDWLQSIKTFNRRLPLHEVLEAAEIADARFSYSQYKAFHYFCGVCWQKIKRAGGV